MNLRENTLLALEGLRQNKMRALLTMLGIIIGIASVIAIASMGAALSRSFTESLNKVGGKMIQAYVDTKDINSAATPAEADLVSDEMVEAFKAHYTDSIKAVGTAISVGGATLDDLQKTQVKVTGANGDQLIVQNIEMRSGRNLTSDDLKGSRRVAVIPDTLSQVYFGTTESIGKAITLKAKNGSDTFRVVGVYKDPKLTADDSPVSISFTSSDKPEVFIPSSLASGLSGSDESRYRAMSIIAFSHVDAAALCEDITDWFSRQYYPASSDFNMHTENIDKYAGETQKMMGTLSAGIGVIAGISLLVGGIGVMNIMLVSVTERTREIGIRKALGASNQDIRLQFIVESIIICLIGGAIGVLLGSLFGALSGILIKTTVTPTPSSIIIAVLFSMAIGVFFGYYPAGKAAKLNPIDALRYE